MDLIAEIGESRRNTEVLGRGSRLFPAVLARGTAKGPQEWGAGSPGFKISPDGKKVAIAAGSKLYVAGINAPGEPATLLESATSNYQQPTWSPNGAYVAFQRAGPTQEYIERVSATGGTPEVIYAGGEGVSGSPSYRQAGSLTPIEALAYSLRPNIYFDTNEKWRPLNIEQFFAEGDNEVCTQQGENATRLPPRKD